MKRTKGQIARLLRRSTALALALVAAWVTARTADLSGARRALYGLSQDAAFAVSLIQSQLPDTRLSDTAEALDGWQRLALAQSPLLRAGRDAADAYLAAGSGSSSPTEEVSPPVPAADDEDKAEPLIPDNQDEDSNVVAQTLLPSPGQSYLHTGEIYIANRANKEVDVAALAGAKVNITLGGGPQILILHTHGSEAYTQSGTDVYVESDPYRTTDCNYNVVRVGEEMARVFQSHGLSVIHDTNLYDYPSYNGAYDRSQAAVERWLNQYPSLQVILDVHRDALAAEDGTIYKVVSREQGGQAAQVMLVVGTDGTSAYHPLWRENLTFAMRLQQQMLDDYDALARPIVLRSSRFNQQLCVGSLLVEVGTHGNTLAEAIAGARLFAESASQVLLELKD